MDRVIEDEKRNKEFTEWRKEINKKLPDLAQRIFSLRTIGYVGAGFHWSLEKSLGNVIARINDYDAPINMENSFYHGKESPINQIILKVQAEELFKDVEKIEKGLS